MRNLLLLAIGFTTLAADPAYAQKYPIRISSRDVVGQKYSMVVTASSLQQLSAIQGGRVLGTQKVEYQVSFEGRVEILAVDMTEHAFRIAYTVTKFTKTENGVTTDVVKPGTVFLTDGSQENGKQIVIKDGTIDDDLREIAGLVMSTHRPNSIGDDEVFGTKELKEIGDKWSINSAAAIEDLKRSMPVSGGALTGTVSLVSQDAVDGDQCLNIAAELNGDGIAINNAPPGFTPESGTIRARFGGCFPINPGLIPRNEEVEMNGRLRVTGIAGTPNEGITLEITASQKRESLMRKTQP